MRVPVQISAQRYQGRWTEQSILGIGPDPVGSGLPLVFVHNPNDT